MIISIIAIWAFLFNGPALEKAQAANDSLRPLAAGENAGQKALQLEAARRQLEELGGSAAGIAFRLRLFDEMAAHYGGNNNITGPQAVELAVEVVNRIVGEGLDASVFTDEFWKKTVEEERGAPYLLVHLHDTRRVASELFPGNNALAISCAGHDIGFVSSDMAPKLEDVMAQSDKIAVGDTSVEEEFKRYRFFQHPKDSATLMRSYLIAAGVSAELAQQVYDIILYHDAGPDGVALPSGQVLLAKNEDPNVRAVWLCDGISMFGKTLGALLRDKKNLEHQKAVGMPAKLRRIQACEAHFSGCVRYTYVMVRRLWPASQNPNINSIFNQVFTATLGQSETDDGYHEWFSRIGEDLYYQTRYFMEEIALEGVSFNDFDIEDFINEAVAAGYEILAKYGGKKIPDSYFYNNIRYRVFQMVATAKGCKEGSLNATIARVRAFISNPPENLADRMILSRTNILHYLENEWPPFKSLVGDINHHAAGQYEHSRGAQRAFAESRVATVGIIPSESYSEEEVVIKDLRKRILVVLKELSHREREIIKLRYGLMDGYFCTLEEVGNIFKVDRVRIRQIEVKAIRKLQQPARAAQLVSCYEAYIEKKTGRQIETLEGYERLIRDVLPKFSPKLPGLAEKRRRPPLTRSEEDRLVAWVESKLPVDDTQRRMVPYVLRGFSSDEITYMLKGPQGKNSQWQKYLRRRLIAKLRLWFTMGILREYGSYEQVRVRLIRLLSETPEARKIRREEEDLVTLQFNI